MHRALHQLDLVHLNMPVETEAHPHRWGDWFITGFGGRRRSCLVCTAFETGGEPDEADHWHISLTDTLTDGMVSNASSQ